MMTTLPYRTLLLRMLWNVFLGKVMRARTERAPPPPGLRTFPDIGIVDGMILDALYAAWAPRLLSVLRFMSGLLLLQHGTAKLLKFPLVQSMVNVPIGSMSGIAGIMELVGGVLLVVGLFTRPTAFLLSGMTAVAYFAVHAGRGFFPILNGGELAALYCFVFLYLAAAGPGPWSVDATLRNRS